MKFLLIITLFLASLNASNNSRFKNCEIINLAELTDIVSCDKIHYLVEYDQNDDEKRSSVKKITAVTTNNANIIKQ